MSAEGGSAAHDILIGMTVPLMGGSWQRDRIGQRDEAIAEARKLSGDADAAVIAYRRVPSFFESLFHGEAESGPIPREVRTLAKLALGTKMLYLWRP